MKDQLKAIHNDYGILGGVQVTHITAVNRDEHATYAEYEKMRKGLPSRIRYNPHIQEIALRRPDWGRKRKLEAKWREAGWFILVLYKDGSYGHNRPWKTVKKKIRYELSHAYQGMTENGTRKQFTTWFGICAYNNVRQKVTIDQEPELCRCGQQCFLYHENERMELAFIKTRHYSFWLPDGSIERAVLKYGLDRGPTRSEDLTPWLTEAIT
ncbi:MAG TPA: hypothetical protein V6C97_01045 [Oculatellaceae cyanobacterium]